MRSIVRGAQAPLLAAALVTALSSGSSRASAQTATTRLDFEARARAALARVSPSADAAGRASLVATGTHRFGDGDSVVRFEQVHHGLPVIGRGAAVRFSATGKPVSTAVDLEEDLPAIVPSLPARDAVHLAERVVRGSATEADAHLIVWPLANGAARLAYAVLPQLPPGVPSAPRVIVDAQTGKVLEARDLVTFAKANVYRFNAAKTPSVESLDLALDPSGEKLTNEFVTSANCIDNKTVRPVNLFGLATSLHVCDIQQVATADASGNFVYAPADEAGSAASKRDEFSEVSMYYHTAKAYEFFRTLQGSPTAQVVLDKPLRAVANVQTPPGIAAGNLALAADKNTPLDTFSNAFFSPAGGGLGALFQQVYGLKGGGLWFGQGPQRDYAYDGDVVYHEFTHAVVDATLGLVAWHVDASGAVDAPGAMNEGLADYFSSAITGDPDVGEYASADLAPGRSVIRTLANRDKCPNQVLGEVHNDSTLFSGALWQARTSLAEADRSRLDEGLYKAMRGAAGRGDLGYDDLAKLFLATLATDFPAGAAALESAMNERGVLPSCDRIFEADGKPFTAYDPSLGGFAAPGTQSVSVGDLAPGIFQLHAALDAGAGTVTVSFKPRKSAAGGNPLGGGGTPFTPVVLAKFDKPIAWDKKAASHDAIAVDAAAGTASFEVPDGAKGVWIQIANKGETDGSYDAVAITLDPRAVEPTPDPAAGAPSASTEGGCRASGTFPHDGGVTFGGIALAGLALAAVTVRRRRRA